MVTSSDILYRVYDCGGTRKLYALQATRLHLLKLRFFRGYSGFLSSFVPLATIPRIMIGSPFVGRDKGDQIMENPFIRALWHFSIRGLHLPSSLVGNF